MSLLDHMPCAKSAPDKLVKRLQAGVHVLAGLLDGHRQLLSVTFWYAAVKLWVRRGRFDKAAGAVDAMLKCSEQPGAVMRSCTSTSLV
jgi:hypothetical protein